MTDLRNPFKLRASESIETVPLFLRLFSPEILAVLEDVDDWSRTRFIRSAPGAGKTSLFRLLSSASLLELSARRSTERCRDLFQRLQGLGAFSETDELKLFGVFLSCQEGGFAALEDLPVSPPHRLRLFVALLNARVVLAALRSLVGVAGLRFPDDLRLISFPSDAMVETPIPVSERTEASGETLFRWASESERRVYGALDSFVKPTESDLPGQDRILDLQFFRKAAIEGRDPLANMSVVLMLDDVHKLATLQRRFLVEHLVDYRPKMGVLLGERLEALNASELLSSGARVGRDCEAPVVLESYWRRVNPRRFEALATGVARRRATEARHAQVDGFDDYLSESLEGEEHALLAARDAIAERLETRYASAEKYSDWIGLLRDRDLPPLDAAVNAKAIELAIERTENRGQLTLDLTFGIEKLDEVARSDLRAAAELTMCTEFKIPYYYGPSRLARLASSNIEQFLWLAGELFEEMLSAALLRKSYSLTPRRQQDILKSAAAKWFANIPKEVTRGREVKRFLQAVATTCRVITYRSGVPYAPGVTGIGIPMRDHETLADLGLRATPPTDSRRSLAEIIRVCVANNYLDFTPNYKCQNEEWMLLHVNRALCLLYDLPVQAGDFSKQRIESIISWPSLRSHDQSHLTMFEEKRQ